MNDSPVSSITPCDDLMRGRLSQDYCRDCGHALAVHRFDRVCSVCDAIVQLRTELRT